MNKNEKASRCGQLNGSWRVKSPDRRASCAATVMRPLRKALVHAWTWNRLARHFGGRLIFPVRLINRPACPAESGGTVSRRE